MKLTKGQKLKLLEKIDAYCDIVRDMDDRDGSTELVAKDIFDYIESLPAKEHTNKLQMREGYPGTAAEKIGEDIVVYIYVKGILNGNKFCHRLSFVSEEKTNPAVVSINAILKYHQLLQDMGVITKITGEEFSRLQSNISDEKEK